MALWVLPPAPVVICDGRRYNKNLGYNDKMIQLYDDTVLCIDTLVYCVVCNIRRLSQLNGPFFIRRFINIVLRSETTNKNQAFVLKTHLLIDMIFHFCVSIYSTYPSHVSPLVGNTFPFPLCWCLWTDKIGNCNHDSLKLSLTNIKRQIKL